MPRFMAKEPIVEAWQWTGGDFDTMIVNRSDRAAEIKFTPTEAYIVPAGCGILETIDGATVVEVGDYIVRTQSGAYIRFRNEHFKYFYTPATRTL